MTLGFIVDTLSCIGDIQHHIVLILMDLERDRSFSGDGIYCIFEHILDDPFDKGSIEIDFTLAGYYRQLLFGCLSANAYRLPHLRRQE